ncbi:hypothetical protein FJU08_00615 [Martelella alba]|uniref:Uncharacterized protein n=1 Tax=Martelella alba TaxID=2590451 RepID=A0A506UIG0_9HYPH|nr:hypothetical protein [Martelella alba]TPW33107.1 hypothetical protein FJU08_00615 [Martelella alba]
MEFEKLLLARPLGGLNDSLVQLELCRSYAQRFGRTLIIDTNAGNLKDDFHIYFEPLAHFGVPLRLYSADVVQDLNQIDSVRPAAVTHQLSTYKLKFIEQRYVLADKKVPVQFDMAADHKEQLLVHEQCGGGRDSFNFLQHVCLQPFLANEIVKRLLSLKLGYDAIHVRHTDYQTDYRNFLKRLAPSVRGRRVLLCTDSPQVQEEAPALLAGCADVLMLSQIPDTGGLPGHELGREGAFKRNIDALTDLVAMACSRRFYFTNVSQGNISGFSMLAESLRLNPALTLSLLRNADPLLLDRFRRDLGIAQNAIGKPVDEIRRLIADQMQWRWNRAAKHLTKRLRKKQVLIPALRPMPRWAFWRRLQA